MSEKIRQIIDKIVCGTDSVCPYIEECTEYAKHLGESDESREEHTGKCIKFYSVVDRWPLCEDYKNFLVDEIEKSVSDK